METLYQVDNKKDLRQWSITDRWSERRQCWVIIIRHGLVTGKKVEQHEDIFHGKGGRDLLEQVQSRINSRVNNQLAKGYRYDIEEAIKNVSKNAFGFVKPMLAQPITKQKSVDTKGAVLQRKLDGNRMLVTKQEGKLIAYSRNGKMVSNMEHILEQLGWIEEGQTVDGEVYRHGMQVTDIRGSIAKKQADTKTLKYHIYDIIEDRSFKERFSIANYTQEEMEYMPNVVFEPWWAVTTAEATQELFNTVRGQGYEGLIMRLDGYGYEVGKRSKCLLKIKERYDAEYEVIDVEVAKDGTGVLVMRLPNGGVVKGVAPGTRGDKRHVADIPELYVGRQCTCSYAFITAAGVPFHLTCDSWRDNND